MTIELEVLAAAGTGKAGSVRIQLSHPPAQTADIYVEVGDTIVLSEPDDADVIAAPADELESAVARDAQMLSVAPEVVLPKPAGAGDFASAVARDVKELVELREANQVIRQRATVDEVAKLAVEKTSRSFMWKVPEVQAMHVQSENVGAAYDFLRANGVGVRFGEPRDIAHSGIILKGWASRFDLEISIGSWVVVTPGVRLLIFSEEEFWATFVGLGRAS